MVNRPASVLSLKSGPSANPSSRAKFAAFYAAIRVEEPGQSKAEWRLHFLNRHPEQKNPSS
jgi:hypothetical protein